MTAGDKKEIAELMRDPKETVPTDDNWPPPMVKPVPSATKTDDSPPSTETTSDEKEFFGDEPLGKTKRETPNLRLQNQRPSPTEPSSCRSNPKQALPLQIAALPRPRRNYLQAPQRGPLEPCGFPPRVLLCPLLKAVPYNRARWLPDRGAY